MLWSELRDQVRRLLIDNKPTGVPRWSNEQLLDFCGWSLDQLCSHTALVTATAFVCDGNTQQFTLPSNIYESLDRSGSVILDDGISISYINSIPVYRQSTAINGYFLQPDNIINTILKPNANSILAVNYYAYYPHPVLDTDRLLTPGWATAALVYRIAAYAHSSLASKTAQIRQWGSKQDSGNPDDNPLKDQSQFYFALYEQELWRIPQQNRENYYRSDLVNGFTKFRTSG